MDEILHPADEIPGGLWEGAWVECRAGADRAGARICGPVVYRFDALYEPPSLLTARGKDHDLSAAQLERLGRACLKYARTIRSRGDVRRS